MSKIQPVVSVIMPVYNRENYLAEAIDSVLRQTFTDFEFIIIDDGSTDRSIEIIQQYAQQDQRIHFVLNKANLGPAACRNKGINHARGKYLALMDSDDVCLPQRFERQVAYLDEHSEVWVLGARVTRINSQGDYLDEWKLPENQYEIKWNSIFRNSGVVCNPAVMMRKDLFKIVSTYDESLKSCDDLELWTRLFKLPGIWIRNLSDILLSYRIHKESISVGNAYDQHSKSNQIRANLLSAYLHKTVHVTAISAYEHKQSFSKDEVEKFIPLWFETYRKFSSDFNLPRREKWMIYKEIIVRTPPYISLFPFSNDKWVLTFLPKLHSKHVFWMILTKIYNLLSGIKFIQDG